jgi:cupin fold WbuC family metalloprotein
MDQEILKNLDQNEIDFFISTAQQSAKKRALKLLHSHGDAFNRAINFILKDSYMQPHLHPGIEKIELIKVIKGSLGIIFFDDSGVVTESTILREDAINFIKVPAYTWHTYVMLSDTVITYETMMGIYHPDTWKRPADWAPKEGALESGTYLEKLRVSLMSLS